MNLKITYILFLPLMFGCAKQKINKSSNNDYFKEAAIESEAGNYERALEKATIAYKNDKLPKTGALKATILYQLKKFEEAAELFKKIIDDPKTPLHTRPDVKNNYACTLLCLNKKKEAKNIFRDLTVDKNYLSPEVAWFNLGLLEFSEAIAKLRDLNEEIRLKANLNFAAASKFFEKALTIACNYVDAYFYLALCLYHLKDLANARNNLLIILSKEPEHKPAQDFLIKLDEEILNLKHKSR